MTKASTEKTTKATPEKKETAAKVASASVKKSPAKTKKAAKNTPVARGTGRRKSAVARVWLRKGNGSILVNGRPFDSYFTVTTANQQGRLSFEAFPVAGSLMADVNVQGGGYTSQAAAIKLGIARALLDFDDTLRPELRKNGFLTVDARVKERKKYGQKGARAKFQFTKR